MGSASSRAVRKLPKEKPSWAGVRTPGASTTGTELERQRLEKLLAFDSKHDAIERDAKDPHFMEKLSQLGPVRVDHFQTATRAARLADAQNMYQSRVRSEAEADAAANSGPQTQTTMRNRLLATSLADLLEARKATTNGAEREALAKRYCIDVVALERLARVVNTPSIDESTVVRARDEQGEESVEMIARWIDPAGLRL